MSDEEYDDELPPISVNSSTRESGSMLMPSAEELASQRAREAACERELRLLRAGDEPHLATADSSGSEGEAALAAAVTRLAMRGEAARARLPALAALLPPLLARLPLPPATADLLAERQAPSDLDALTDAMCSAGVAGPAPGCAALLAAWLLAAGAAAASRARRRAARRALHALLARPPLDDPDSWQWRSRSLLSGARLVTAVSAQEESRTLKAALLDGVGAWEARAELADALAAVRAPLARLLAARLLAAALADLLHEAGPGPEQCLCGWAGSVLGGAWARLPPPRAAACVRLAGRVLRACGGDGEGAGETHAAARARLLAALGGAAPASARSQPDRLEVLVGAAKLQLLFREEL